MKPLEGIRIIDLTTVLFGPYASQVLGDYGAQVIKVEAPAGDSTRYTGPGRERGLAPVFLGANRNKRSLVLDLKLPAAQRALHTLVTGADVFMHSMRPQKLAALGLEPAKLRAANPRLVFANLVGFASDGPYSGRPAYDDVVQGLAGCADLMRRQSGTVRYFPTVTADKTSALVAAHGILAALFASQRTGSGCVVEIPMFESTVAFNLVEHLYLGHFDDDPAGFGYPRALDRFRAPFKSRDGHVCMLPYTDAHWRRFFAEVGAPELADDPRFVDIGARTGNISALYETAGGFAAQRTTAQWLATCDRLEIPAAPVNLLEQLPQDPHLLATGYFEDVGHPGASPVRMPGFPVTFDGRKMPLRMAPRLGEHTRETLAQAGLGETAIDELISSGAARQWVPEPGSPTD
ncbi:MAG: CoA transferase [Burkholderiaceae bacterium]